MKDNEFDEALIRALKRLGFLPEGDNNITELEEIEESHFGLGCPNWPGAAKVLEETSELNTEIAKLIATGGDCEYFDGSDMIQRIEDEIGDSLAAIFWFINHARFDGKRIEARANEKSLLYAQWAEAEKSS